MIMENKNYILIAEDIKPIFPVFLNYIEIFSKQQIIKSDYQLLMSKKTGSYSIIAPASKLISSIIDFSEI